MHPVTQGPDEVAPIRDHANHVLACPREGTSDNRLPY
jgi:hypothetical protein